MDSHRQEGFRHRVGSADEATEVALCFGWIDSHRRAYDDLNYLQRYSPRRRGSRWSARNIATAEQLMAAGRMRPAGRSAFERRPSSSA